MIVTAGFYDSQASYAEPAKWVAKLRASKIDTHDLVFKTDMTAGHDGRSGRLSSVEESAEIMGLRLPERLPRSSPTKKDSSEDQCGTAASPMYRARIRRGGVLHFAGTAVALTAFVAAYLLLNGEEQLPNPHATQLENIQRSILEKKSNRL